MTNDEQTDIIEEISDTIYFDLIVDLSQDPDKDNFDLYTFFSNVPTINDRVNELSLMGLEKVKEQVAASLKAKLLKLYPDKKITIEDFILEIK